MPGPAPGPPHHYATPGNRSGRVAPAIDSARPAIGRTDPAGSSLPRSRDGRIGRPRSPACRTPDAEIASARLGREVVNLREPEHRARPPDSVYSPRRPATFTTMNSLSSARPVLGTLLSQPSSNRSPAICWMASIDSHVTRYGVAESDVAGGGWRVGRPGAGRAGRPGRRPLTAMSAATCLTGRSGRAPCPACRPERRGW
jgi:hypothetical protein